MAQIEIIGLNELYNLMNKLPDGFRAKALFAAFRFAARKHLTPKARQRVAVDEGILKKSIGIVNEKRKRNYEAGVWWGPSISKKTPAYHAHLIERGTKPHKIKIPTGKTVSVFRNGRLIFVNKKEIDHPGTKAQPFIEPTWNENRGNVMDTLGNELGKQAAKQVKKYLKK